VFSRSKVLSYISGQERIKFRCQLQHYEFDVPTNSKFQNLTKTQGLDFVKESLLCVFAKKKNIYYINIYIIYIQREYIRWLATKICYSLARPPGAPTDRSVSATGAPPLGFGNVAPHVPIIPHGSYRVCCYTAHACKPNELHEPTHRLVVICGCIKVNPCTKAQDP